MDADNIISPENLIYAKPYLMNEVPMHYCPGCSHGVVHKLIAEVIQKWDYKINLSALLRWDVRHGLQISRH
jgi:hypothetical protein